MSDRPWLSSSDPALRLERELLKRLNSEQPPAAHVEHGWAALSAELGGLHAFDPSSIGHTAPHAAAPQAIAASAGLAGAAKVVAGIALAGGALWTGSELMRGSDSAVPQAPRPMAASEAPVRAAPLEPAPIEALDSAQVPSASALPVGPAPRASSATSLAEEGKLLGKAHQLIQTGKPAEALEVLRLSRTRYPRSALFQEREVLTIEALGATGSSAAAKQRAAQFLKRYPGSPHVGRLERFVE